MIAAGTQLFTRIPGEPPALADDATVRAQALEVFETMEAIPLFEAHNKIHFYTWGDERCCLPKGATHATLRGALLNLKAGDVLIFEEVIGPRTGRAEDADPAHRCAVRLTHVKTLDAGGQPLTDLLTGEAISEIFWGEADALPFPLCISAQTDSTHGGTFIKDVSAARGNIVLADHGRTVEQTLGEVPKAPLAKTTASTCDRCEPKDPIALPVRFRPKFMARPLTFATLTESSLLFGFTPGAQDAADLDNKILPTALQERFEAVGIGFPGGASIQGTQPFWSISDSRRGFMHQGRTRKVERLSAAGSGSAAPTSQEPRRIAPCGEARKQTEVSMRSNGSRCAICSTAAPSIRTSSRRSKTMAPRGCVSAMAGSARGRKELSAFHSEVSHRQRRGRQRRRRSDRAHVHEGRGAARRDPLGAKSSARRAAASNRRRLPKCAPMRRRRFALRSAPSPRRIMPR